MAETVKVFVSYSWGVEEETKIVDDLEVQCSQRNIKLIRDRNTMKHGDSIREFIARLTGGERVITVFSKSYFKSEWCMLELLLIWQKGGFQQGTHPLIADDCDLQDLKYRLEITDYWQDKLKELEALLAGRKPELITKEYEQLKRVRDIAQNVNDIIDFARIRNTTPLLQLRERNFSPLLDNISLPFPKKDASKIPTRLVGNIPTSSISQEISILDSRTATKLTRLEQQLELWEDKLHAFEMKIPVAEGPNAEFSIRQHIKNEINPEIVRINKKYGQLLNRIELAEGSVDEEANEVIADFIDAAEDLPKDLPEDLMAKLNEILVEVKAQNKSATAKLKVTLPIIPLLASYELDIDTETFLGELWEKARGLLTRQAKLANP